MSGVLRRFNEAGIAEFVRRIELLRAGGSASIDDAFMTADSFSKPVVPEVRLERPAFKTKREAGAYLSERTRRARERHGDNDQGLWTWLAAWHWDAICPADASGNRRVLNLFHYVYGHGFTSSHNQRRHLVAVAVRLFELAPHSLLMLETPFHTMPKVVSEISGRVSLTRVKALPALLDKLYWDSKTKRQKPGAVSPQAT